MDQARSGVVALCAACVIWGLSPLYYKLLIHVPPPELLAHRTLWSAIIFLALLAAQGRIKALGMALGSVRALWITLVSAIMISVNWGLFILSVQIDRVTETALGYYIFPLVAVLLGVIVLRETLSRAQWLAVALACVAVCVLTVGQGVAPWISLILAFTFGLYGLIKKQMAAGPVVSVTAEVLVLMPFALGWLMWLHLGRDVPSPGVFGQDIATSALLIFSGFITAFPLVLFSRGAQQVRLATVGLVQFINPTLQFLCAVLVFSEPFGVVHAVTFALIWIALALYSANALAQDKARRRMAMTSSQDTPV